MNDLKEPVDTNYKLTWKENLIFVIGFLIFLFAVDYIRSIEFDGKLTGKSFITCAEVYDTWEHPKGYVYGYYFYEALGYVYKASVTGSNLRNLGDDEIRKFAVVVSKENPAYHFVLWDHKLADSVRIGDILENKFISDDDIFERIKGEGKDTGVIPKQDDWEKYNYKIELRQRRLTEGNAR